MTLLELSYICAFGDISFLNVESLDKLYVVKLEKLPTKLLGTLKENH